MTILFPWVTIPNGLVTLTAGGYLTEAVTFSVDSFDIGRYPVTNAQFHQFMAAGGYANQSWWDEAGWLARTRGNWTEPRFWHTSAWTQPDHPVVGVSWYEAQAFCRWATAHTGQQITLPTEQQWQRTAQGDDGRFYPWGNSDPSAHYCNWNRLIDETSPVQQYPAGASPFGVLDMCGNVWEWCLTGWENGTAVLHPREPRLLRGGSWSSDSLLSLRVTNRQSQDPNTHLLPHERNLVTVGFRCVRLAPAR